MATYWTRNGVDKNSTSNGNISRTILWCVPRSGSTALTKCLSFIEDIQVWFEPYTFCKVAKINMKDQLGLDLPPEYDGNEEIYKRMADHFRVTKQGNVTQPEYLSYASVCNFLEQSTSSRIFMKEIAIEPEKFRYLPKGYRHMFLIRHPLRVYASFRKSACDLLSSLGRLTDQQSFDISDYPYADTRQYENLHAMWKYTKEKLGVDSVIIDADDMLSKPGEMLPKICQAAGLPYDQSLLRWDESPDVVKSWVFPAEGIVERTVSFYGNAVGSGEFFPASKTPSRNDVTPDVIRCTDEAMAYYNEMFEARIKI